ncbi:TIGR03773 family transporter-associated surface protein [Streptomyces sp. MS19]|uniref:TIGR03773 family transporter-associated surface protein n=1 Tax=Streptomyces sp. MS19 TaxID=3385972 RepID=UPI0039A1B683
MPVPALRLPLAALLAAACALLPAAGASAATAPPDDDLDQTLAPDEEVAGDQAVLDTGHVDIGPRFLDGDWRLAGRDDSVVPPVWHTPDDIVVRVADAAIQQAPDRPEFGFLDAEPGSDVHVIPQTQQPDVVWLGWNTQDPEVMDSVARGVTLTLHGVEGPGHFSVFLQNGDLGAPDVLWDGDEAGPQDIWVDVNTHTHANWVFTEPGVYALDVEVAAELVGGEQVSDRVPLWFAVGDGTDPADAFAAAAQEASAGSSPSPSASASASSSAPESGAEADGEGDEDSGPSSAVLLGAGAAAVVLLALAGATALRGRRARARAEQEAEREGDA